MEYDGELDSIAATDIGRVARNEKLSKHSNWLIGGPADLLVEPQRVDQIATLLDRARRAQIPLVVIGTGCNLLFSDEGVRGIVVKISQAMSRFSIQGTEIEAQAGTWIPRLARSAGARGLTGLEHTIGIPSTLGGLVVMNGGSLRQTIGTIVRSVRVIEEDGEERQYSQDECGFGRRRSMFQASRSVILSAELSCSRGDPHEIRQHMLEILRSRRGKFPRKLPNCGSVFVSGGEMYDEFGPPGKIIEDAGLKGLRARGAQVSPKHANFIVNLGGARSSDVLGLIHEIRRVVHQRTAKWMATEVRFVSADGTIRPAHEFRPDGTADHTSVHG